MKIVCIGAGSMAEAMINGWIRKRILRPGDIAVMNKSDEDRLDYLEHEYGVRKVDDDLSAISEAKFLLLAVKPKDVGVALASVREFIRKDVVILSVVAGVSIDAIQKAAGDHAVARAMPNTSAHVGKSATGVVWSKAVTKEQQYEVRDLLNSIGSVTVVGEDKLHGVTGVAGSGPAYLYLMAEAMVEAGMEEGLEHMDAMRLVRQTFLGAADMMQHDDFSVLRKKITSPNGTTQAGLNALIENGFKEAVHEGVKSAAARSKELGKEFS
ncbi:pyrroline-5-carboxylate reductase [Indiicoccus explosivorum]|uniref:pyrroline-5-carboxylate reductase n=1 Tax=Indiicoccus explosivorum TaxID=1917864 RepID=UPI000B437F5F|nr:pyrroline-5-carboxylate reductase [Indiicoccus explosivorum]